MDGIYPGNGLGQRIFKVVIGLLLLKLYFLPFSAAQIYERDDFPLRLTIQGNEEKVPWPGGVVRHFARTRASFQPTRQAEVSIFSLRKERFSKLPYNPHVLNEAIPLCFPNFTEDVEWWVIETDQPLTRKQQGQLVTMAKQPQSPLVIAKRGGEVIYQDQKKRRPIVKWQLYKVDVTRKSRDLLLTVEIIHADLLMEMWIQRAGKDDWESFSPEQDEAFADDQLQWRVVLPRPLFLVVFLRDSTGQTTFLLAQDAKNSELSVFIPAGGTVKLDHTTGVEYLACFYSGDPLERANLQEWLQQHQDLRQYTLRGPSNKPGPNRPPPASLYLVDFQHPKRR